MRESALAGDAGHIAEGSRGHVLVLADETRRAAAEAALAAAGLAAASVDVDRDVAEMELGRFAADDIAPLALYGVGHGATVACVAATAQRGVRALVLDRPLPRIGGLQRVLLLRERFRTGSDVPSMVMRGGGEHSVGDWLAAAAAQAALLRMKERYEDGGPAVLMTGAAEGGQWLADRLKARGVAHIETVERARDDEIAAWLAKTLA